MKTAFLITLLTLSYQAIGVEGVNFICDEKFTYIEGYNDPKLQKKYNLEPYPFNTTDTFETFYFFNQNKNIRSKSEFRDSQNTKFICSHAYKEGINEKTGEYLYFRCSSGNFSLVNLKSHHISIRKYSSKKYFLLLNYSTKIGEDFFNRDEFSTRSWAKCTE